MKQIGFKNFRRFESFPAIDLAPITILVGENNAGKSTVVKGILALSDFLNSWREDFSLFMEKTEGKTSRERNDAIKDYLKNQKFYFNTIYLAHIGTFKRALYNKAENSVIEFYSKIGQQEFTIVVGGDRDDEETVYGIILRLTIEYKSIGFKAEFDLQNDKSTVTFSPVEHPEEKLGSMQKSKRDEAIDFLSSLSRTYTFTYNISDYFRRFIPDLKYILTATVEIAISASMDLEKTKKYIGSELTNTLKPIDNLSEEDIQFLKDYTNKVCVNPKSERWIFRLPESRLLALHSVASIEYIYAHAVTQTVIYSGKDTNDYLSRTIHEFASLPKLENDYRRDFITFWMKEFDIGEDYEISSVGGEAHIVKIKNKDGDLVNLADKGMGSIQLMVLLFRLAITLPKKPLTDEDRKRQKSLRSSMFRIIIIEEPEQNLHPMLQSKLADLLYNIFDDYGYRFLIETHSEYLIRKTQVMVGEKYKKRSIKEFERENPFKVYYFPQSGIPYDMEYTNKGGFKRKFGDGFFNEATRLNSSVIKNKLEE